MFLKKYSIFQRKSTFPFDLQCCQLQLECCDIRYHYRFAFLNRYFLKELVLRLKWSIYFKLLATLTVTSSLYTLSQYSYCSSEQNTRCATEHLHKLTCIEYNCISTPFLLEITHLGQGYLITFSSKFTSKRKRQTPDRERKKGNLMGLCP